MRCLWSLLVLATVCLVAPHAFAQPTTYTCYPPNPPSSDPTQNFCTDASEPYYGQPSVPLLTNQNASPGDGLTLGTNAKNVASYVFGSGQVSANVLTTLDVYNNFFLDCINGNLQAAIGAPQDSCQGNDGGTFYGVARHYPIGSPYNLHAVQSDGLHLDAHCGGTSYTNCTPGNIYAAWIRLPGAILPGEVIKVRYKAPAGKHSWTPVWLFSNTQLSPGPNQNPYQAGLNQYNNNQPIEIDINDNYCRYYVNPPIACGSQLDFLLPSEGLGNGDTVAEATTYTYWANSNGYVYTPPSSSDSQYEAIPANWSTGFHDLVFQMSAENTTTGQVTAFTILDGKLVEKNTFVYNTNYVYDYSNNTGGASFSLPKKGTQVGLSLMIGNQPVPAIFGSQANIVDNDGVTDGWTIVVQEVSVWTGGVTGYTNAGTNACNTKTC